MKRLLLLLLLLPIAAVAQSPARFDLPVLTTTPGQVPPGAPPPLLAVTNATVSICGYPATLSSGMCTNTVTTYTDSTLGTACPSTAQLTAPGSAACVSTTGLQGSFGFWYNSAAQTHMTYTVKSTWGTFGPYDILPGGSGGGGGVTQIVAGTNVTVSPSSGLGVVTVNATGGGSGCGSGSNCVVTNPTTNQIIAQPAGTLLGVTSYDPQSSSPAGIQGYGLTTNMDFSTLQVNSGSGQEGTPGGMALTTNYYGATNNTQNTFGGVPKYSYGAFLAGITNTINRYNSGQTFGSYNTVNCHGAGDCLLNFSAIYADGGINAPDDEGVHSADVNVSEDPDVWTGSINGAVSTGATIIPTSASIGGGTQGKDRLLIDTNAGKKITGTFTSASLTATVNQVPFGIGDPSASYPVSTFVSLCYAGSDNGAGGAAGCPTNGTAPSGYIPPQASSPTQQAPSSPIVAGVMDSYTNQPSYFCTNSNLQSSNSGSACYMPASGVGCLTDAQEYETVNYTYNSGTQQVTLLNLQSSHLNGMVFATGGLCGYAVEASNTIYSGGGTSGVQSQVFPIEGSPSSTTILDITQRTNEGYGAVAIGNSENDLNFSTSAYGFSLGADNLTVSLTIANPSGFIGCLTELNLLTVTIATTNSTWNGSFPVTQTGCNSFTYVLGATPSGSVPSTATVSYNNLQYTIFPSARVLSVYDAAAKSVDGNFYLMPNTMAWASGDTVREPHYQQMNVTGVGNPTAVTRFTREQYLGTNSGGIIYNGITAGNQSGYAINNTSPSSLYLGHGGTYPTTGMSAYGGYGLWYRDLDLGNAPEQAILSIDGWKADIGASSIFSNFAIFQLGIQLPGAFAGYGTDALLYDPNYNAANRGQALTSGRFLFGQELGGQQIAGTSVTDVEAGYFNADVSVTAPTINTSNFFTSQLTNIKIYANIVGTPGSTSIDYWVVAHAGAGGVTVPVATSVNTANATLSSSNYVLLCMPMQPGYSSYDILKGSTSASIATAVTINGASFGQVPNYACVKDTGQSTSLYYPPTQNTTGGVLAVGPLIGGSIQDTGVTVAGCGQFDSSGNLTSTGTACGSGGGGGSGTVTNVAVTVPDWLNVSGSPITTAGTFALTSASESANQFLASPNGSSGLLAPRTIVAADIPTLNQSTTGNAATATALAATPSQCSSGEFSTGITASGVPNCSTPTGTISGGTTNYLPLFTSSTALGNSPLSYSSGNVNSSVPIVVSGGTAGIYTPTVIATTSITTPSIIGSNTASFVSDAGAGGGAANPACASGVNCSSSSATLTLTTGSSPATGEGFVTVSFPALPYVPTCHVQGMGAASSALQPFINSATTTNFVIYVSATPAGGTAYKFTTECQN